MADRLLLRLGHRIRQLRNQRGWSQVVAAEKIGLDRSFLADVERGRRNISIRNLYLIARGFQKTLAQLLSGV
jgi:transcriptional regulator with XRE-family HTH domain